MQEATDAHENTAGFGGKGRRTTGQPEPLNLRKPRYRTIEAARYLEAEHGVPVAPRTLDKFRCDGGGPKFRKFGHKVLYERTDLDAWALERLGAPRSSTSEAA